MTDFLNKLVAICLIFTMLVLVPLLISYSTDYVIAKRLILNDVSLFIDKVKDTGYITEDDINKLYLSCNSHGLAVDVKIYRLVRADVKKGGDIVTVYYSTDKFEDLQYINSGDIVKVTVSEIGISIPRRIMYSILRLGENKFEFSLAGVVG